MRVDFNNPEFPVGTEFDVGGILLVNGEEVEVGEDDLALYEAKHGQTLKESLSSVQFVSVDGVVSYTPPPQAIETQASDQVENLESPAEEGDE